MVENVDASDAQQPGAIIIKKYANRRLYNTKDSTYITLENLKTMIHNDQDFLVLDAKTNKNITRSVLTQIILDEETKMEHGLLPINFLQQMIRFYSDPSNSMLVPKFLESSMQSFCHNQQQFQKMLSETFSTMFPMMPNTMLQAKSFNPMKAMNPMNAMNLWNPFSIGQDTEGQDMNAQTTDVQNAAPPATADAPANREEAIAMMTKQMEHLQAEITRLNKQK
ncbi:MAG: polyhydroxyalkanoate synthesis repressor PhaR [Pseudomonadota bacterium]